MNSLSGKSILILEDENLLRKKLSNYLNRLGADVFESANILSAKDFLKNQRFDVCLFDINLPDGNSLDLLKSNIINSETIVIVMTSDPSMQTAIDALKFGAKDYLTKPFESAQSLLAIQKSFKSQKDDRIKDFHKNKSSPFIFGKSLLHIEKQFELLAKKEKLIGGSLPPPVLIEGETGTGKSALAKWIHYNSNRSKNEFIQINCANLQEQIAESELFGHEKGSFTDAKASRIGLFEAADESTF